MCGIAGMVALDGAPLTRPHLLEAMGAALAHRGPDGYAALRSGDAAFGATRLRVIDLNPRADQPFADPDGTRWLSCNGEIYNARELRRRFPRYPFRSQSDCEVILPLIASGPEPVADLEGMFALAGWDATTRTLTLARDRAGEKPLYYARVGPEVWFASEIPALLVNPDISRALDEAALSDFLQLGYVREPRTMFAQIRQVRPGSTLSFAAQEVTEHCFWEPAARSPEVVSTDTVPRLRTILREAVARQVTSDVPLGVFLSGGVDSALVAALAARAVGRDRVRAFSIGFSTPSFDEAGPASRTAQEIGLQHSIITVDHTALRRALDECGRDMAEPLADPALLPTYLLAREARQHVAVVLGGEGADELFGGYPTYRAHGLARRWRRVPRAVRHAVASGLAALPTSHRRLSTTYLLRRFVAGAELAWPARHHAWFGTGLPTTIGPRIPPVEEREIADADLIREARLLDFRTYLRDGLLVKLDRATMRVGLEARSPYLDRQVMEFALGLRDADLVRGVTAKPVLRRAADAWLSREVSRRPKRGLSVPVSAWLNDGLAPETDRLLDPGRLRRQGVLDHLSVARLLGEHRARRADHGRALWALVVLQLWFERYGGGTE